MSDREAPELLSVLLPVLNFSEHETGVGKYTFEMAKYFAEQGHSIQVLCAPPYYPWWKVQKPYSTWKTKTESIDGMRITRCPLYVPQRPTGLTRALHLGSMGASVFLPSMFLPRRVDVVWMAQPSLTLAPAGLMAAGRKGAKTWLHVQDLEVAAARRLKVLPNFATNAIARMETALYRKCDSVSTISKTMGSQLEQRGAKDVSLFPNWVDTDGIRPLQGVTPYRAELGIPESTCVVLYSGNMGEKQGLDIILDASRILRDEPDLLFLLAGQGMARQRLERAAAGLPNVRFLPLQPFQRMRDFLALGDIHLVPQKSGVGDVVMPSKMTSILSAGKSVVATCDESDELGIVTREVGFAVQPENSEAFAEAILKLVRNPEQRARFGRRAREYAEENLSAAAILPRMEKHLRTLTTHRKHG